MQKKYFFNAIFLVLNCIILNCYGQDSEAITGEYSYNALFNPEPRGFECVKLWREDVLREGKITKPFINFDSIYFSGDNIKRILADANCVGLWFDVAMKDGETSSSLIMRGVDIQGNETSPELIIISSGCGSQANEYPLPHDAARESMERHSANYTGYGAFISKDVVQKIVYLKGATGIHVRGGKRRIVIDQVVSDYYTLIFCPAKTTIETTVDLNGQRQQYIKSLEACPYICGAVHNLTH